MAARKVHDESRFRPEMASRGDLAFRHAKIGNEHCFRLPIMRRSANLFRPENDPMLKYLTLLLPLFLTAPAAAAQGAIAEGGAPVKGATAPKLAGTTWSGYETLEGFDKLAFQFKEQGVVTMTDATKKPVDGKFTQNGDEVTITVLAAVYTGKVVGNIMSGNAELVAGNRKGQTWKWKLSSASPIAKQGIEKNDNVEVVRQGFPANQADDKNLAKSDTAWEIEWDLAPVPGKRVKLFRIVSAKYMWKDAKGQPRWLTVARNLQLAEAFAQYDNKTTCFLDIAKVGVTRNIDASDDFLGPFCVGGSEVLKSNKPDLNRKIHKEVHYDGMRWMSVYGNGRKDTQIRGRKGEKLVLWSAIQAGNYIYLVEYDFTDDGRIISRLGFTAHNFFQRQPNQNDVHPHIGCWRFDFDLSDPTVEGRGGPAQNDLALVRRVWDAKQSRFRIHSSPFPGDDQAPDAREGKAKWVAREFTTLRATSRTVKNSHGTAASYDVVSSRTGTAEDLQPVGDTRGMNMDFINYDFWVTRTPTAYKHYHELPTFAATQPLKGERATVWHSVPGLHVPRDEDFGPGGTDNARGVALTGWVEFTLRPRNLFDSTPLYAPVQN
jgi:hypothetical protein